MSAVLFLISPLLSYFSALKRIRVNGSIFSLILIGAFIGFIINTDSQGFDLYRYLEMLKNSKSLTEIFDNFRNGQEVDLYVPISVSVISLLTSNGHILMMWFGIVFGFVYAKSLSRYNNSNSIISYVFIFIFANIYGYNSLAGVRFATAFYILFYGVTGYISRPCIKNLLIIGASVLVHFGMMPGVGVFLIYILLRKKPLIIYVIAVISFVFTFIDINILITYLASSLGQGFSSRAEIYSTDNEYYVNYLQENAESVVWFIRYRTEIALNTITLCLVLLAFFYKRLKLDSFSKEYLSFILVWLTLRNLVCDIPDFGIRYTLTFIALSIYFAYKVYINNQKSVKAISIVFLLGCALCPIYAIRQLFDYLGLLDLIMPPIYGVLSTVLS